MATVYLGLGSNIDPELNLRLALDELERRFGSLELSSVYRGPALGFEGPDFLNLVVRFESQETPRDIHAGIEAIHDLAGRERSDDACQSRTLDIDLLLCGDLVLDEPPLRLPRSDVLDYAFVLRPLAELAPELRHPETGRTMRSHWEEFNGPALLTRVDVVL